MDEELFDEELQKDKKVAFSFKAWKSLFLHIIDLKKLFFIIVSFVVAMALIDILFPLIQGYIIDNYIYAKVKDGLPYLGGLYIGAVVTQGLLVIFFFMLCIKLEMLILKKLRDKIFNKFQLLPVSYFNNRSVGYLVAKTMSDTERIGTLIAWGTVDIGWSALYIVGMFIPMFILNWKISLIILALLPVAFFFSAIMQKKLLKKNREIRHINSEISGALNEGITGAKTIKTLSIEDKMTSEFKGQTAKMCRETFKYNNMMGLFLSVLSALCACAIAAVIALSGYAFEVDGMSVGDISIFISYTTNLMHPIMQLSESLANLVSNQANVERTLNILNEEPKIIDTPEVIEKYGDVYNPKYENWEQMYGEIEFENVSFKYEGDDRYILKNFSLKIPKGSSLALVGETGAGKSTIVNLICRFYEPTEGRILIDGRDYRERSQLWLSKNLGYVLQTPHLFSGTVRDNIKYPEPSGTDERMIAAAKMVYADKVIDKLQEGYDSEIGECGDSLSMGEKQLLTFARAVYADPKIVILDEATSSIDTETEALIQQAITKIFEGRTSVTIAHRLSTIKNSDMILLINDGQITERGNHKELMAMKGNYYSLYMKMFELECADKVFDDKEKELTAQIN